VFDGDVVEFGEAATCAAYCAEGVGFVEEEAVFVFVL
jgi:hypothetical protein